MKIHREGYLIICISILVLFLFNLAIKPFLKELDVVQQVFWALSFITFGVIVYFFREPKRQIEMNDDHILAPADGKVVVIEEVSETEFYNEKRIQVSIFMSPLNIHVNWSPIKGIVKYVKYHPGKFLVAWHPKSSTENERTTFVFDNGNQSVLLRQIAGFMARRIVYYPETNGNVEQGEQIGFIKFGSRVDLFLPLGTKINVGLNEKVEGQKTVIASFS